MRLFTSLTISCLALAAWAFDPATDRARCTEDRYLCLTSFVWCATTRDSHQGCSFPPNSYPWFDRDFPANPAGLFFGERYNVSWENHDPDYPVMVEWSFGSSEASGGWGSGVWSQNVTGASSLELSFAQMAREFPTTTTDLSAAEVVGMATSDFNFIRISQPERPSPSTTTVGVLPYTELSDQFVLMDSYAEIFIQTEAAVAEDRLDRKWTLGVGIGVGIGAPLLMLGAFLGGWSIGRRRGRRLEPKKMSASS